MVSVRNLNLRQVTELQHLLLLSGISRQKLCLLRFIPRRETRSRRRIVRYGDEGLQILHIIVFR